MQREDFEDWVIRYGVAWEARDGVLAGQLFNEDATYQWTPFDAPLEGREAIVQAWVDATATQRDVRFAHQILGVEGEQGIAHWTSAFTRAATGARVEIDGILVAEMTEGGKCQRFREWWHALEPADRPIPPPE